MIVIDTSVLIDALHRKDAALRKIMELEEMSETLCLTQVNVLELYKGVYSLTQSAKGLEKVKKLLDAFVILDINEDTYDMFGELSAELGRKGEAIGDFDELIASTVLTNGAAIASEYGHFRRVPGLKAVSLRVFSAPKGLFFIKASAQKSSHPAGACFGSSCKSSPKKCPSPAPPPPLPGA